MVNPFFSGQIPDSIENDETVNPFAVYHKFLIAYPAYTIERVEDELSWREVRLLLDCWEDEPPLIVRISRIEKMLETKFGMKPVSNKQLSSAQLIARLEGGGYL